MEYLNQSVIQSGYEDQLTSKTTFCLSRGWVVLLAKLHCIPTNLK